MNLLFTVLTSAIGAFFLNQSVDFYHRRRKGKRVELIYAHRLEEFTQFCSEQFEQLRTQIFEYMGDQTTQISYKNKELILIDYSDSSFMSDKMENEIRSLFRDFRNCNFYIRDYASQDHIDVLDAYHLETQRLAFYGAKAFELANKIRAEQNIARLDFHKLEQNLLTFLGQEERNFISAGRIFNEDRILPELQQQFQRKYKM